MLLADLSQVLDLCRVRLFDEHVTANVLLEERGDLGVCMLCDDTIDSLLDKGFSSVRSYKAVQATDYENHHDHLFVLGTLLFVYGPTVMTTFPRACPSSIRRIASPISLNL